MLIKIVWILMLPKGMKRKPTSSDSKFEWTISRQILSTIKNVFNVRSLKPMSKGLIKENFL